MRSRAEPVAADPPTERARSGAFASLANHNFRRYFCGQIVSAAGTFMQSVALGWLVLEITGSGTALGLAATIQYGLLILFGSAGGVLTDRFDHRRVYVTVQILAAVQAGALGLICTFGTPQLWMVYVMAALLGLIMCVEQPVRQTFILDLVGADDLGPAVSLNMALTNVSRVVGPALAGVLIATVDIGICFFINAASYAAVILALLLIRKDELHTMPSASHAKGQVRTGLRTVRRNGEVVSILATATILFGLAWQFDVVLPLIARFTFGGDAGTYGLLTAAQGVGAVVGGLFIARTIIASRWTGMRNASALLGIALLAGAVAPTLWIELLTLVVAGGSGVAYAALAASRLQLLAAPTTRGLVMALWTIASLGVRAFGGPIVGFASDRLDPRFGLGLGAIAAMTVAVVLGAVRPGEGRVVAALEVQAR